MPSPTPDVPPPEADRPTEGQQATEVRRKALSVSVATGAYGISFGELSVSSGLTVLQTQALSALLFSGASQFAFVGIIGAAGGAGAAVATSTLLGLRNGLYGLQTSRILQPRGLRRLLAAQLTIDESAAVAIGAPTNPTQRLGFWWAGLGVFVLWNLMTLVGALLGDAIGDPKAYGLDAAATAAFCGLLWPRLRDHTTRSVAVAAALLAVLLAMFTPAGVPILAAAALAVAGGEIAGRLLRNRPPSGPRVQGARRPDNTRSGQAPPDGTSGRTEDGA